MAIRNLLQPHRTRHSPAESPEPADGEATKRRRGLGQSVVEFAIILPILLLLVGGALDFARIFYTDLKVQSATRNAAEYIATDPTYSSCMSCATWKANYLVCTEVTGRSDCGVDNPPVIEVTYLYVCKDGSLCPGATAKNPIATVRVKVSQPFDMLFPYPLMSPPGHWTLVHETEFSVVQGR